LFFASMQYLGTVEADTKKQAIAVAIKQFQIEPARKGKMVVTKISERDGD
jgi:hypothetical protein